jgi:hypothetical protein
MHEHEWLDCADPRAMLLFVRPTASDRKLRLFSCACCRRIWPLIVSWRSMEAVIVAERHADSLPGGEKLPAARTAAWSATRNAPQENGGRMAARAAHLASMIGGEKTARDRALEAARLCVEAAVESGNNLGTWAAERLAQAHLVRDIFGNPFRPVAIAPEWLTWKDGTVLRLAQTICDGGNYDEVPVLADALEDAGCTEAVMLEHCRSGGAHVRGCWVVDCILGRA